jgi:hypothetical protein
VFGCMTFGEGKHHNISITYHHYSLPLFSLPSIYSPQRPLSLPPLTHVLLTHLHPTPQIHYIQAYQ